MSDQTENEIQQTETQTPEEVRQALRAELDASKQEIETLSDEQLETIIGAGGCLSCANQTLEAVDNTVAAHTGRKAYYQELRAHGWNRWPAAIEAVKNGDSIGKEAFKLGAGFSTSDMRRVISASWPSGSDQAGSSQAAGGR